MELLDRLLGNSFNNPRGLVERGNIDIYNRPQVRNADGSISTVRSMSFSPQQGLEVLIPTVSNEGAIMTPEQAINTYYSTGQHLGKFNTPQNATKYADMLHRQQEGYYVQ